MISLVSLSIAKFAWSLPQMVTNFAIGTLGLKLDKAAFCAWLDAQEQRHEWKEGRVVQMTNVTKAHARAAANFVRAISARLDLDRWSVTQSDLGVEDEEFIRFPDVIVEPMDTDDDSRRARQPVLLVEILSPSSVGTDFTEKLAEYTTFASLQAYIIASQDEPILWIWRRSAETGAFPATPVEISGRDAHVEIPGLGIALPLAELYRGVRVG